MSTRFKVELQGASFIVQALECEVEGVRVQYECFGGEFFLY